MWWSTTAKTFPNRSDVRAKLLFRQVKPIPSLIFWMKDKLWYHILVAFVKSSPFSCQRTTVCSSNRFLTLEQLVSNFGKETDGVYFWEFHTVPRKEYSKQICLLCLPWSCPGNVVHLLFMQVCQGHPTTVFCKISVRGRENCLEFSIAWGRLKISRWLFHSCTIFEAYLINFLRLSKV